MCVWPCHSGVAFYGYLANQLGCQLSCKHKTARVCAWCSVLRLELGKRHGVGLSSPYQQLGKVQLSCGLAHRLLNPGSENIKGPLSARESYSALGLCERCGRLDNTMLPGGASLHPCPAPCPLITVSPPPPVFLAQISPVSTSHSPLPLREQAEFSHVLA